MCIRDRNIPAQHRSVSTGEFNLDGKPDLFVATDSPLAAWQRLSGDDLDIETGSASDAARESVLGENQIWFSKTVAGGSEGKQPGFDAFFPTSTNLLGRISFRFGRGRY